MYYFNIATTGPLVITLNNLESIASENEGLNRYLQVCSDFISDVFMSYYVNSVV